MPVTTSHDVISSVLRSVRKRDPNETEFQQAVSEVLGFVEPVLDRHPRFADSGLISRLVEPERSIQFRVPWIDDEGEVHVNRGYRTQFSSVLGPYKGGLRFHPTVSLSVVKFLGFEQIFKNALTGMSIGAGKGGSDFDPRGRSDREVMRFCQSFMSELHRHIGADTDVPAGDIGVGEREIGYLFGQYRRLSTSFQAGALTGKAIEWSGSEGRTSATGYGLVYFVREMLQRTGESFENKRVVVSGSGNVAYYAMVKATEFGARVVACSDSSGYVVSEDGLDLELLHDTKIAGRGKLADYVERSSGSCELREEGSVWDIECDIALPCATENEVDERDAKAIVDGGARIIAEGANMPCTQAAIRVFDKAELHYAPGKAANAGGVSTSALEMAQNAQRQQWSMEQVDEVLNSTMIRIHKRCIDIAEEYGRPGDYAFGATAAGFLRVASAMTDQGVV